MSAMSDGMVAISHSLCKAGAKHLVVPVYPVGARGKSRGRAVGNRDVVHGGTTSPPAACSSHVAGKTICHALAGKCWLAQQPASSLSAACVPHFGASCWPWRFRRRTPAEVNGRMRDLLRITRSMPMLRCQTQLEMSPD